MKTWLDFGDLALIFKVTVMGVSRGGGGGGPDPLKNQIIKNQIHVLNFLSNSGPDPLKNHKAAKPACNFGPLSARQQNAI